MKGGIGPPHSDRPMISQHPSLHVAVTGASGLLGRALVDALMQRGHKVIAGVHRARHAWPPGMEILPLDLTIERSVSEFATLAQADWIIHAAGMTDVDRCETEAASAALLNHAATRTLVDAVRTMPTRIVYLSTDYVFDGQNGPYREDGKPNPINVYGRTKYEGETAVRDAGAKQVIVRSAGFLGIGGPERPTFVERMIDTMRHHPPLRAAYDQLSNITPVEYLARSIVEIIEGGWSGLWHVAGQGVVSRYDLALQLARLLDVPSTEVQRVAYAELGRPAKRPLNGGLVVEKAIANLSTRCDPLDLALRKWKNRLVGSADPSLN